MKDTENNLQNIIFALDIGTRSVLGTVGVIRDKKFHVLEECYIEHEERAMVDGQIHDVSLVSSTVEKVKRNLEDKLNIQLTKVSIAAAGRFLKTHMSKVEVEVDNSIEIDKDTIRSLELTAVKKAEEEISQKSKGKLYCVGYSVKNYYLNEYIISNLLLQKGDSIAVDVIATFLPRYVVDSLYSVMKKVGLIVDSLTLEPIAAIEAAIPKKLRLLNLALVDIGAGTSDIAICSKDSISAFGMVSVAGDEVTEAIAQNYLVDFDTAERIKKECLSSDTVKYTDVVGLENEIESDKIIKIIEPVVTKIAEEISLKMLEVNGEKAPNAVFLVGGGAHTPLLKEKISERLNLPLGRIAIKDRQAVTDCECEENKFGSEGVTVLGIALTSIRRIGNDFIDVMLNGNIVSLFNSHTHSVMDAILQAGINPKVLMGKNGKNIRFVLNNIKRVAFGTLASNAEIKVNGIKSTVESNVKEGDNIEIEFAKNGKTAEPKIKDYIKKINSVSFYINDIMENLEPIAIINNNKVSIDSKIQENDKVEIVFPKTLGDFKRYYENETKGYTYFLKSKFIEDEYIIKEGDRIYKIKKEKDHVIKDIENNNMDDELQNEKEDIYNSEIKKEDENFDLHKTKEAIEEVAVDCERDTKKDDLNKGDNKKQLYVIVNEEEIELEGKENYVFVDIFNKVEFDLSVPRGNLVMKLNGKEAKYYDNLKNGDKIEIRWE
ncbi:cell division protein FtsA [Clostridium oceanicum]|uniref:Rod shape-determining protein n=1 Tax=Clostridium oceanicum TaxID=1543 RepID=A0ABN1JHM0_9CLOT